MNFIHHMSNELACKTQREGQGRLLLIGSEASCIIIGKASLACYRASSQIMRGKKEEEGEEKGGEGEGGQGLKEKNNNNKAHPGQGEMRRDLGRSSSSR